MRRKYRPLLTNRSCDVLWKRNYFSRCRAGVRMCDAEAKLAIMDAKIKDGRRCATANSGR